MTFSRETTTLLPSRLVLPHRSPFPLRIMPSVFGVPIASPQCPDFPQSDPSLSATPGSGCLAGFVLCAFVFGGGSVSVTVALSLEAS